MHLIAISRLRADAAQYPGVGKQIEVWYKTVKSANWNSLEDVRAIGKMTLTFDETTYSNLLAQAAPKVIETEVEYERVLALTEKLHFTKNRTVEQRVLYKLLVTLVELYESEHYPIPESQPYEVLQQIMEASGTRQADLVEIIGSSSVVSEIIDGKRAISKAQAKILGERFSVSPSVFF